MSAARPPSLPVTAGNAPLWAAAALAAGVLGGGLVASPGAAEGIAVIAGPLALAALLALVIARPVRGVYVLVATAPFTNGLVLPVGPVTVTPFVAAVAAALLAWAFEIAREGRAALPPLGALGWALAAPAAAALWSLPLSLAPGATAGYALRLIGLWATAAFVIAHARDSRTLRRVLVTLVAVAAGMALVALAQYAEPGLGLGRMHVQLEMGGVAGTRRPSAFYLDPNFLAGLLSAAGVAAAAFVVRARAWRAALGWGLLGALCAAGILVTLSRTALVGAAAGLVVVLACAPRRRALVLLAVAALALAVAAPRLPASVTERLEAFTNPFGAGSTATRYLMVGSTLEIARDHWATGTGLGAFDRAYPEYRRPGSLAHILRPHELPLAMAAEMGLAGVLAEAALLAAMLAALARRLRAGITVLDAALLAALTALLAGSFFQYYLYFEPLWLLLALWAPAPLQSAEEEAAHA